MRGYFFSEEARHDLREIWLYVAEDSVDAADFMREEIEEAADFIGEHPESGHTREDLTSLPLRFWNVHSCLIIYRADVEPIEIVRVLSGYRDIPSVLGP